MTEQEAQVARAWHAYLRARALGYKGAPPKIIQEHEERATEAMAAEIAKMESYRRPEVEGDGTERHRVPEMDAEKGEGAS